MFPHIKKNRSTVDIDRRRIDMHSKYREHSTQSHPSFGVSKIVNVDLNLTLGLESQSPISISLVSFQRPCGMCEMPKSALENSSVSFRKALRMSFLQIHRKETYKSMDPTSITKTQCWKLVQQDAIWKNSYHQPFEIWVSCGFFKKRDVCDAPAN